MIANPLQNSPAEIMQELLITGSGAVFTDPNANGPWSLYISVMPDGEGVQDNAGAVTDTDGIISARLLASRQNIVLYGAQIRVRSRDYNTGFTLLSGVSRALEKVKNHGVAIGGNSYTIDTLRQTSAVISMGQDEQRRYMFSLNILVCLINL